MTRTVFQLSRSIRQIIAFDKGVPPINAPFLDSLCEYRHEYYTAQNYRVGQKHF